MSVIEWETNESLQIRMTRGSSSGNPGRHGYPIETHDAEESALAEVETFVHELDSRGLVGRITDDDPSRRSIASSMS